VLASAGITAVEMPGNRFVCSYAVLDGDSAVAVSSDQPVFRLRRRRCCGALTSNAHDSLWAA
jgi:hypothetical protein